MTGKHADVLPFGLAEDAFVDPATLRPSREVLLVGAMQSAFNRDAIHHFVRDIHPALASIAGVRFTVVGGALPPEVAAFARQPGVEIAGHASDLRPFLARASCLLVPLRFAGGIRIRILYAMAAGLPVVSSPAAIEGMGFEAGREVLVASAPAECRSPHRAVDGRSRLRAEARAGCARPRLEGLRTRRTRSRAPFVRRTRDGGEAVLTAQSAPEFLGAAQNWGW
jgi:hypothetical protein